MPAKWSDEDPPLYPRQLKSKPFKCHFGHLDLVLVLARNTFGAFQVRKRHRIAGN